MKSIYIACASFFCISINAQTMFVRPIVGSQTTYSVSEIQKITFENGNLIVVNTNGANGTFALSDNRYINFTDLTLGTVSHQAVKSSFYVYPNPTTAVLNIANDDTTQTISNLEIISLEGRVLMKQNTPQVEIASLPTGMYFCRITTNSISQIIKFLKQ